MKLLKMPRCPLMFSSSPSGPWEGDAPGVSSVRSRKLRPFVGSPSITSSASRCEVVTSSVAGVWFASSLTVISSATTSFSPMSRFRVSPTRRVRPAIRSICPGSSFVTISSYDPSGSRVRAKVPEAVVSTDVKKPVSLC